MVVCDLGSATSILFMVLSAITSVGMLAYKAGLVEVIRLRWNERVLLKAEQERAAVQSALQRPIAVPEGQDSQNISLPPSVNACVLGMPPAAGNSLAPLTNAGSGASSSEASSFQAAPDTPAVAHSLPVPAPVLLNPEFAVARSAPSDATASGSAAAAAGTLRDTANQTFRGKCPAWNRNVYSTHEGRVKEGDRYYHQECVKGPCSKCGRNVFAEQERGRDGPGAPYFHITCPP
jgi:hypothetical protein